MILSYCHFSDETSELFTAVQSYPVLLWMGCMAKTGYFADVIYFRIILLARVWLMPKCSATLREVPYF